MSEAETANVLMQVVNGLLYLKVNNILHRDMSLSNLLLTNDLKVKIADFGLATQLSRPDEKHTTLCGTPNYISPEVASRATHGLPVDVWGLGCMMYTLLVGKPPFDTDGVKSTLTRVVMADFVVPNSLSIEAKDLLNRLLRKNPSERIHIEDVLTHPFMLKHLAASHPTYSNTVASVDSGLLTMSSGMTSAQNLTQKMDMRLRTEEQNYSQTKVPVKATNVFDNMRVGHSASSLYNRYDSQYNDFAHHSSHRSQSNELVDRIGNLGLMQTPHVDKQIFGSAGVELFDSKPTHGNLHTASDILSNHTPMPLQENRFYGIQSNLTTPRPTHNLNYEPMLTKQHPSKGKSNQKLSVPPLNSERLLPTRFKTKTAILSILPVGEVVVELIKYKDKYNEDRVVDVCRISKDGLRIVVYQPDAGR